MLSSEVPLEVSGPTYNRQPLVYVALAAQKNYNALYLKCADASDERVERLAAAFTAAGKKFDMCKSCVRFKRADDLVEQAVREELASTTREEFVARSRSARS